METIVASTPWWINALLGIVVANLLVWPLASLGGKPLGNFPFNGRRRGGNH